MSIFQFIPGVGSLDQAARGEIGTLTAKRDKFKDGEYNFGDHFRGFLGGYSQEQVRERAKQLLEDDINNSDFIGQRTAIQENLPGATADSTKIRKNETRPQFEARLAKLGERAKATQEYIGVKGSDLSLIEDLNPTQIRKLTAAQRHQNEQAITDKGDKRYTDALVRDAQIRADDRRDRREDRAMERELRMMELDQKSKSKKAELFQALFGLGSAFMI
jgi:hypothetical protein